MMLVHWLAGTIVPMPRGLVPGTGYGHLCLLPNDHQHVSRGEAKHDVDRKQEIVIIVRVLITCAVRSLCFLHSSFAKAEKM